LKIVKRVTDRLKTSKYHITCSWILLFCFVAGQYMVYAHQHSITTGVAIAHSISKKQAQQTVKEKCYLCDVMHHNAMVKTNQVRLNPITVITHVFKSVEYTFTSLQLILSGGRAPPVSNHMV
jgi:hypothetical protein